ncbi:hypothetical protein L6R50_17680 [Myxococcota bacterium]|nr:hypothetical protein [Myxococcota bacterium]
MRTWILATVALASACAGPELWVDPTEVDFGEVEVDGLASAVVEVCNKGSSTNTEASIEYADEGTPGEDLPSIQFADAGDRPEFVLGTNQCEALTLVVWVPVEGSFAATLWVRAGSAGTAGKGEVEVPLSVHTQPSTGDDDTSDDDVSDDDVSDDDVSDDDVSDDDVSDDDTVASSEDCSNEVDDDGDGAVDCADLECVCTGACVDAWLASDDFPNLLAAGNPGFDDPEHPPVPAWFPDAAGTWGGDQVEVVPYKNAWGVDPHDGAAMLRFVTTNTTMEAGGAAQSELFQLYDATALAGESVCFVARFLRVAGDTCTDTLFASRAMMMFGLEPELFPEAWSGGIAGDCETPGAPCTQEGVYAETPMTWVTAATSMFVPTGAPTITLALEIFAGENVCNDETGVEFEGHFADSTGLYLLPSE